MTERHLDEVIGQLPTNIAAVHAVDLDLSEPFIGTARRFAHLPGTVALLSGTAADCARYNILGLKPWLTLHASASSVTIAHRGETTTVDGDPFDAVQKLIRRYALEPSRQARPITAGLLGYLSYDLKDCLETLPRTSVDDLRLPHAYLVAPSILLVQDRLEPGTRAYFPCWSEDDVDVTERVTELQHLLTAAPPMPTSDRMKAGSLSSGFSREQYLSAVEAIRDYIVRGHVYQVNMSQRFRTRFEGDAFELFARLFERNPAPFFAYVNARDHYIVSTSPERFVAMQGQSVETRPIKGTRARGTTPDEDDALRRELETSPKDDSELSMVVDLLRNDIGKVCRENTIQVAEHKRLETYENVHHLVSIVRGELDAGKDAVDLLRATFPGGSITGCPKIRAMEVIDELEPVRRHIYTGSIGYISFHDTMDLSIAIRTATICDGSLVYSVGGGVVYDSNPVDEYQETLHKGRTLSDIFDAPLGDAIAPEPVAWCNGVFRAQRQLSVSVDDEGFLYGYGIFETIRVQRGNPCLLDDHVERFNRSWQHCFRGAPPDVTWRDIIAEVVSRNDLSRETAAVKLLAAAGAPGAGAYAQTLLVTARKYTHRLAATGRQGLRLAVYPHRRHGQLFEHKTMNYMFYRMAAAWSKEQGSDEAVIVNHDGSISETNTASLFWVKANRIYLPESEHVLPGTMQSAICKFLLDSGNPVEQQKISVAALKGGVQVFVANALMGAVPVLQIDETTLADEPAALCRRLNEALLG